MGIVETMGNTLKQWGIVETVGNTLKQWAIVGRSKLGKTNGHVQSTRTAVFQSDTGVLMRTRSKLGAFTP